MPGAGVWSTSASVVVTEPDALAVARGLVEAELSAVDLACGRFREDAELTRAERVGRPVTVSPLLAELLDRDPWGYPIPRRSGPIEVPDGLARHAEKATALCPLLALRLVRTEH